MQQFRIKGPTKLSGMVKASGSKNAALPIIAATTLINHPVTLHNVPKIKDVEGLLKIIEGMGAICEWNKNSLVINCAKIKNVNPDPKLVRNLRASVLLAGPLLARNKQVSFPHPGGCLIGTRPIDVHTRALSRMGATVSSNKESYSFSAENLKPVKVSAEFSVTGTENIIMAAILTPGTTEITLAAAEPHVQDLCQFLNQAGAKISGIGTHNLKVEGVQSLRSVDFRIIPDQIEAGTFAVAIAATEGSGEVHGFVPEHHESLLAKFDQIGVRYEINNEVIIISEGGKREPFKIRTEIYPGFPTDLQAPMAVLATKCQGESEIHETIFEGRLGYANELAKMGASITVRDAHQLTVKGPTALTGTRITSFDLRAGATLIIAAICASGESRLDQIEIIDRGYEDIEAKLKGLGADIKRITYTEIE